MAKRAILNEAYGPVKSSLDRYRAAAKEESPPPESPPPAEVKHEAPPAIRFDAPPPEDAPPLVARGLAPVAAPPPRAAPQAIPPQPAAPPQVGEDAAPAAPMGRLTERIRVPVTPEEHELWHELAQRATGRRQNLSPLIRAMWSLLENAQTVLEERAPQIASLKRPGKEKHLERALYEQRLAQHLYDALRAGGRPSDRLLKR